MRDPDRVYRIVPDEQLVVVPNPQPPFPPESYRQRALEMAVAVAHAAGASTLEIVEQAKAFADFITDGVVAITKVYPPPEPVGDTPDPDLLRYVANWHAGLPSHMAPPNATLAKRLRIHADNIEAGEKF